MAETDHLGLPFIEAGQAQKHVTHNEALRLLDVAVQLAVTSVSSSPPGSPAAGERRIVGASPAGAFSGHADEVAAYQDGAWVFAAPKPGWRAWNIAEETLLVWNVAEWTEFSAGEGGGGGGGGEFDPENVDFLYINGADPEDETTKLAVRSNDILLDAVTAAEAGTGDVRLQLSKEDTGDTASVFFSHDFDGRAEFGLVGSNDFRLKVSADGETWVTSLLVNPADGIVSLPLGADLGASEATAAQFRANTADKYLSTDKVWLAAAIVSLSDGTTIAVDMSAGFNFSLTLGGNRTLGNPSNTKVGQSGAIVVTQDGTGSRTLSYAANWEFAGGSAPVLSTAANAKDVLFYWVQSSTSIIVTGILKGVA
jgi:hypothetical protein